jgi:hypothetical protein
MYTEWNDYYSNGEGMEENIDELKTFEIVSEKNQYYIKAHYIYYDEKTRNLCLMRDDREIAQFCFWTIWRECDEN